MKSFLEFEQEFFRRLKYLGGNWETTIQQIARGFDYPEPYAREKILKWARQSLIEVAAYAGNTRKFESWQEYRPADGIFFINYGSIMITLLADGEECCPPLTKRPIGF
jgi:hypothetical protein